MLCLRITGANEMKNATQNFRISILKNNLGNK